MGEQVETPAHIESLVEHKRAARHHRASDRLFRGTAPVSHTLLHQAAERGYSLGTITAALIRLLERYGAAELRTGARQRHAAPKCRSPRLGTAS
ncbi:MAG: hypothetical protein WCJ64_06680 [Rhodospirillaceae bacterium]